EKLVVAVGRHTLAISSKPGFDRRGRSLGELVPFVASPTRRGHRNHRGQSTKVGLPTQGPRSTTEHKADERCQSVPGRIDRTIGPEGNEGVRDRWRQGKLGAVGHPEEGQVEAEPLAQRKDGAGEIRTVVLVVV